jgi:plastocyanin
VHRWIVVIALLCVGVLAACSSEAGPTAREPTDPHLSVVAKGYAFDPPELPMVADQTTLIYFTNEDGEKHDIAIYTSQDSSTTLFSGELIGKGSTVYEVPGLAAGSYAFKCTVHPVMTGSVTVAP